MPQPLPGSRRKRLLYFAQFRRRRSAASRQAWRGERSYRVARMPTSCQAIVGTPPVASTFSCSILLHCTSTSHRRIRTVLHLRHKRRQDRCAARDVEQGSAGSSTVESDPFREGSSSGAERPAH
jgi:hypothetical protein